MPYTIPQNLSTIPSMMRYSESVTDGFFIGPMLFSLYVIVFLYLKQKNNTSLVASLAAGFLNALLATLLAIMDLVTPKTYFIILVVLTIPTVLLFVIKR